MHYDEKSALKLGQLPYFEVTWEVAPRKKIHMVGKDAMPYWSGGV